MTHRNRYPFTLLPALLVTALVFHSAPADAQKRIVVLDVEGARSNKLRDSLAKMVAREHRVIKASKYRKAAKQLKARKLSPSHVSKVSRKLRADGVLEGMIVVDDDRYVLRLRLRSGSDGRTTKKLAIRLRQPKLSRRMRRALGEKLLVAIDDLPFIESDEDIFEEDGGDVDDEISEVTTPKRSRLRESRVSDISDDDDDFGDDDDDDDFGDDDDSSDFEIRGSMRRPRDARNAAMNLNAGLTVVTRTLQFQSRSDLADNAPEGYKGPMAPAAVVYGELYPLAINDSESNISKLGVAFSVEKVIGLTTAVVAGSMAVNVPTDQMRWSVGARYRHNFGSKAMSPTLKLGFGYGKLSFTIDRPEGVVIDVPDTAYTYFAPSAELRVPVSPKVALTAGGMAMLIVDAGAVQSRAEYGTAKMTGFEAGGGIEYLVKKNFVVRVGAKMLLVGYEFKGDGEQSNNRDGDAMTVDVGGASDKYLSGSVTAGYLF